MAELILRKLSLRNWTRFRSASVDFPEYGLVMVAGHNTASGGKFQSIGTGKTSLGEALGWAVLGVSGRFNHLKECSTDEKGNTYAVVDATFRGKPLRIEMGYKCAEMSPTGEALRFHYDGKTVERALIRQTREDLGRLLGVDSLLASWTIFIDGDDLKFDQLSQADRVNLVMAALRQPPWSAYHEKCKATLLNFQKVRDREQGVLKQAQVRVTQAQDDVYSAEVGLKGARMRLEASRKKQAESAERILADIQVRKDTIASCEARKKAIAEEVKALIDERAVAAKALEVQLHNARDATRVADKARDEIQKEVYKVKDAYTLARNQHGTLTNVPTVCPICRKPWDERVEPERLEASAAELAKAREAHDAALQKLDQAVQRVRKARQTEDDIRDQLDGLAVRFDVNRLSAESSGLDRTLSRTLVEISQLEARRQTEARVSDEEVRVAEAVHAERLRAVDAAEKACAAAASDLALSDAGLKVIEYWTKAFSPAGIPNMILRDSVDPLNHEARRVSAIMTGGTIGVRFSTSRTKVSGDLKPELLIDVDNQLGSRKLIHNSKGETGLTNLIVAETLAAVGQIGQRIGFRWFDEVVPHQDPVVCRSIYTYLRELAEQERILIFMVDHNPVAANYAHHFLRITKSQTGAVCESTADWDQARS